jgi:hypothetical protein
MAFLGSVSLKFSAAHTGGDMIYVKSIIAGLTALLLALLSLSIGVLVHDRTSDFSIGWDPRGLRSIPFWIVVIAIFALGYLWEYRRLSKRISTQTLPSSEYA